jgi:spermidine synthase
MQPGNYYLVTNLLTVLTGECIVKLPRSIFFPLLFVLFFLSGLAGLIYESIWSHYLKLFVGHAAYAQTLVLVIYMGGMALGSWLASNYTNRIKHLLPGYAITEIIIGITALTFHSIFTGYISLSYNSVMPALSSPFLVNIYKWITAPLLILPQTILLGATFPLISSGIIRLYKETPGHTISVLYFVNSLGGALGVLLSGFYLIEKFTFPGTVKFAGIIDIIVGAEVIALWLFNNESETKNKKIKQLPKATIPLDTAGWTMLAIACATAASSFIYEVGWIRMLSLVLGSSTHSFELMLSAFILGLAIGGFWIKNRLDSLKNPIATLAIIQVAMGVCAIATLVFYSKLFYLMKFFIATLSRTDQGYVMFNIYSHFICLILMLPATIFAGMTLPIITWYLYKKDSDESMIGKVYAFNTLGSIIGVLLSIQILMPLIGLKFLLITGGAIDMLIGLYLLIHFRGHSSKKLFVALTTFTLVSIAFPAAYVHLDPSLLSSGVYRFGQIIGCKDVIYYKDGKTSSVSLMARSGCYSLANNGKPDASVGMDSTRVAPDEHTQILLAAYPLSYATKCDNVGVIGLGSGMTASVLLESNYIKKMDVVEIEPYIIEAAKLMGPKVRKVFTDNRSKIHIDDAKTFFSANRNTYDIIISEPSNPWVSGVSSLFSVEFFKLISRHLSGDGMLVQWLHLYEMSPDLIASVIMSINKNFSDYKVFGSGSDLIILASNSPIRNIPGDEVLKIPKMAALLHEISIEYPYDFNCNYIGGKQSLSELANMFEIPLNSDYNPILDLKAVKARFTYSSAGQYVEMGKFVIPMRKLLENDTIDIPHITFGRKIDQKNPNAENILSDYEAWQAWLYITTRGTNKEKFADSVVSKKVVFKTTQISMIAHDRSMAAQQIWPKYVLDLLKMTMPYLPPARMKDVWNFVEGEAQNIVMRPDNKDLFTVLKCITYGDFETARNVSMNILGRNQIVNADYNKIFAAAFLLSSIKLQRYDNIQELWNGIGQLRYDFNLMMLYGYAYRQSKH